MDSFLKDGAALLALGGAGAYLRSLPNQIASSLLAMTSVTITLNTGDHLFDRWYFWLSSNKLVFKPSEFRVYKTPYREDEETVNELLPVFKFNMFKYRGTWFSCSVSLTRAKEEGSYTNEESITIRAYTRNNNIFSEIKETLEEEIDRGVMIETRFGRGGYSRETTVYRSKRSINTIYLADDFKQDIVSDLEDFLESKEWYQKHSIMWKRGYLLWGEPGGGKSSLIVALASKFNRKIVRIDASQIDNETFASAYSEIDANSFLVLEDVDCSKSVHREGSDSGDLVKGLTFDCLLNYLDGPCSKEGVVTFITTNYVDKLDSALIRPGRIDKKYEMPKASYEQKKEMFLSFYPNSKLAESFCEKVESVAMASLQEIFIKHKNSTDLELVESL